MRIENYDLVTDKAGRDCEGCAFDGYPAGCMGMAYKADVECQFGALGVFKYAPVPVVEPEPVVIVKLKQSIIEKIVSAVTP